MWDISKVDEHKKGLTDKQKRQWVHIANSMHKKCMDDGGDESSCAIKAIKGANGSVNTNDLENYSQTSINYQVRTQIYQGKKQIIVPVVMMVEGVHSGSHGPLLHLAEDLGKYPASWDGIPVMIGHPSIDGYNVSANIPEVLEQSVGRVFHSRIEDNKLKAEVWLDEQKLIAISPTALSYIQEGRQLEVSVGVYTDEEQSSGIYTNSAGEEEQYNAIARNHRPDHLALLPGESGACGWSDGCGIRANSGVIVNEEKNDMNNDVILTMKKVAHENILMSITDNKQGYFELIQKIQSALDAACTQETAAMDQPDAEDIQGNSDAYNYNMIEEVYDGYIVYRKRCNDLEKDGWYQQSYIVNADDSVSLSGEPVRVRREVNYVQINKMIRTKINSNKGENKMPEDKPCCLEKVVELLGNSQLGLTEADDREWLLGLGPERLARLTPKDPQVIEVNKEVRVEAPIETDLTDYVRKDSFKTAEDVLAIVPEEMKEQFQSGLALHQAHRDELVQVILDNSVEGVWTKEELSVESTAKLEKLSKQFKAPVDYSGKGAGGNLNVNKGEEGGEKLLPPGI